VKHVTERFAPVVSVVAMMICPNNKEDGWFVDACRDRFYSLWDSKKMCATSKRFPQPFFSVIVEILDLSGNYVGHTTYHRKAYKNQGEAYDRDDRIVILWRGWEFTQ
jgi:hypothetical protein